MIFTPSQVKAKEGDNNKMSKLCRFLKARFLQESQREAPESTYRPHRYIIDLVHSAPPRILLGSQSAEKSDCNLFHPEPSILRALSKSATEIKASEQVYKQSVESSMKSLFQYIPELKTVQKSTFLDESDDELPLPLPEKSSILPAKDSLFESKNNIEQIEGGGLFGYSNDLPKLSRVGRLPDEDVDLIIKLDDSLNNDSAGEEEEDDEHENAKHIKKRQKLSENDKKLDKEVEMYMKRKAE